MTGLADKLRKAKEELENKETSEIAERKRKSSERPATSIMISPPATTPLEILSEALSKIADSLTYDAIRFAICKCDNLFQNEVYGSNSGSTAGYRKTWNELMTKQKWERKPKVRPSK